MFVFFVVAFVDDGRPLQRELVHALRAPAVPVREGSGGGVRPDRVAFQEVGGWAANRI